MPLTSCQKEEDHEWMWCTIGDGEDHKKCEKCGVVR